MFSPSVKPHDYDCEDQDGCVRLYRGGMANKYSGRKGIVQVKQNGTWNFINGSDWDYCDANVFCRELGECAPKIIYYSNHLCNTSYIVECDEHLANSKQPMKIFKSLLL